ncbi:Ca(2+)-dependent cysteine protease [Phlyctochytrium bullatum]|nr:Ca(2+)-dependent cysteine protease [Phlyctochytrium bullatum]
MAPSVTLVFLGFPAAAGSPASFSQKPSSPGPARTVVLDIPPPDPRGGRPPTLLDIVFKAKRDYFSQDPSIDLSRAVVYTGPPGFSLVKPTAPATVLLDGDFLLVVCSKNSPQSNNTSPARPPPIQTRDLGGQQIVPENAVSPGWDNSPQTQNFGSQLQQNYGYPASQPSPLAAVPVQQPAPPRQQAYPYVNPQTGYQTELQAMPQPVQYAPFNDALGEAAQAQPQPMLVANPGIQYVNSAPQPVVPVMFANTPTQVQTRGFGKPGGNSPGGFLNFFGGGGGGGGGGRPMSSPAAMPVYQDNKYSPVAPHYGYEDDYHYSVPTVNVSLAQHQSDAGDMDHHHRPSSPRRDSSPSRKSPTRHGHGHEHEEPEGKSKSKTYHVYHHHIYPDKDGHESGGHDHGGHGHDSHGQKKHRSESSRPYHQHDEDEEPPRHSGHRAERDSGRHGKESHHSSGKGNQHKSERQRRHSTSSVGSPPMSHSKPSKTRAIKKNKEDDDGWKPVNAKGEADKSLFNFNLFGGFKSSNAKQGSPTKNEPSSPAKETATSPHKGAALPPPLPQKKALLIGINYSGEAKLNGCINDVKEVKKLLGDHGFEEKPDTMLVLTDDTKDPSKLPTKENILKALKWLRKDAKAGDQLYLHFSGHGEQQTSLDSYESMDETLVPMDWEVNGMIVDNELNEVLVYGLPKGLKLTCVFDCCHSGTILDLPFEYTDKGQLISLEDKHKSLQKRTSQATVVLLSGCADEQTAADASFGGQASGALTYAIKKTLQKVDGRTLSCLEMLLSVRKILKSKFQQLPQLSASNALDLNKDVEHGTDAQPNVPLSLQYEQLDPAAPPPPSFEEAVQQLQQNHAQDAQNIGVLPPDYFDVSLIPNENVVMRQSVQPMEASGATFERKNKGIISFDESLQHNPDELYRFFLTHLLEKPGMKVWVTGTHPETRVVHETHTNSDGSTSHSTRTETHTVTDFSFGLDATPFVAQDWTAIFALPKGAARKQNQRAIGAHVPKLDAEGGQFRAALEEFTRSKNLLKEIQLEKEVVWDFATLRRAIHLVVRRTGYFGDISVTFPRYNHVINVHSSSAISRAAQQCWVWVLLSITCLWIIFLPLFFITRKKVGGRLCAHYYMTVDSATFFNRNVIAIMNAARMRAIGVTLRAN